MIFQESFQCVTTGRGLTNLTAIIAKIIKQAAVDIALCNVFIHHTSASIIICENADPDVQRDLAVFMERLVPDGDPLFCHTAEGPDDMPAHVRSILTQSSLNLPITRGRLDLGTWQGIYLWEHRLQSHNRKITVTIQS